MLRTQLRMLSALALTLAATAALAQTLPPVPVPGENPITEEKRVLGKILFWEEQLSTDNTIACGTCHAPADGGADARLDTHPGADGVFGTADDVFGSPAVVRRNPAGQRTADPIFGFDPQVTDRAAPNFFGGSWAPEVFWDGRAGGQFIDPLTGTTLIASGGALENQALAPILSDVEMAKEGRTWAEVTSKLAAAVPLAFATDLPADVAATLAGGPTYRDLFQNAFGDPAISPARIAFAIATYERTLVPDQTPWDAFIGGNNAALTADQRLGWNTFRASNCTVCHLPPLFTDGSFRTIGVRPPSEDIGRQAVTGDPADRGSFKVPTLRNTGVKLTYMHNGGFETVADVVSFYQPRQSFPDNRDPLVPAPIAPAARPSLVDFIENGLTDPRVAAGAFPFDRPKITAAGRAECDSPDDVDCDGIPSISDLCPEYPSTNKDIDGNGIGDECECGDQNQDGRVGVLDILAINAVISGAAPESPLCDTNEDQACNVEDILGANAKIFGAPAYCARYPSP